MKVKDLQAQLSTIDGELEVLVIGAKNEWNSPSVFDVLGVKEVCMRNTAVIALNLKEWV